jgi:hypothetical protein
MEEVFCRNPHRFCREIEPKKFPFLGGSRKSTYVSALSYGLAARLSFLANQPASGLEASRAAAVLWQVIQTRAVGETFKLSLARQNREFEDIVRYLCRANYTDDALVWTEILRGRALMDAIGKGSAGQHYSQSAKTAYQAGTEQLQYLGTLLNTEANSVGKVLDFGEGKRDDEKAVGKPADWTASLPEDTCVLDYYLLPDEGYVWVINRKGTQMVQLQAGQKQLAGLVTRWREGLFAERARSVGLAAVPPQGPAPTPAPKADPVAVELYKAGGEPVLPLAGEFRHWCVSPHGSLKYLSFAALSDGNDLLLNRRAISYLPSLEAWKRLQEIKRPKQLRRIVCLGNPDLGKAEYNLPGAEAEAKSVAALFPASRIYLRGEANLYHFALDARNADVLHLACHTLPLDERGNRALCLSPTDRHSGMVGYQDLYTLKTPAFLVSMSACSTGLGEEMKGDEILGFTRGFLAAGIPSMLYSLWDVPDQSTSELMTEFYKRLPNRSLDAALQEAQQSVAARHPSARQWAAFVLYGLWAP